MSGRRREVAGAPSRPEHLPHFRAVYAQLGEAQKAAARSAPAYSRFINRRLGRVLAAAAFMWGLSSNAVTAVSAVLTFSAATLLIFLPPSWPAGAAVATLLLLGYAFDSADGQVARLTGGGSPAGEWLDHIVDAVKTSALPLALAVGLYRFNAVEHYWLLVPLAFSAVSAVLFFAMILTEQLRRQVGTPSRAADLPGRFPWLRSVFVLPMDYGVQCVAFVLLGNPALFLPVYTFIAAATTGFVLLALPKWFREMKALAPRKTATAM
ncbi:CDP-alcohol phosphatidyltransferase family protein [Arthrobacter zhaoxinii]|uniref:CDP-alcohol phosphatidyltransferase family protein n=1 Tax=Arthrobacter zhaoxinii TaxID=2964616 RepID=UPI0021073CD1|nr:CDP-alcohol phosphatidyltransferase family protein [Arthrobacter zhaoxinii]MCQ2001753.1 CDP-alcohol phosphatidyltransferase family protein [Arthrobacter zhaoxinii]